MSGDLPPAIVENLAARYSAVVVLYKEQQQILKTPKREVTRCI